MFQPQRNLSKGETSNQFEEQHEKTNDLPKFGKKLQEEETVTM